MATGKDSRIKENSSATIGFEAKHWLTAGQGDAGAIRRLNLDIPKWVRATDKESLSVQNTSKGG